MHPHRQKFVQLLSSPRGQLYLALPAKHSVNLAEPGAKDRRLEGHGEGLGLATVPTCGAPPALTLA